MALFKKGGKQRYALIVDIGSGSVLVSIIESVSGESHPTIIWSHREQAPLKKLDSIHQSAKGVMSALVNACMKADSEGRKVLYEHNISAKLVVMQVAISAPWSYTVTKTVNYKSEEPFMVTDDMIGELLHSAQSTVDTEIKEHETVSNLGLTAITRSTMSLMTNGYRVANPEGEKAISIELAEATVVAQQYLIDAILEMHNKLFPTTKIQIMSFILMLHSTLRTLAPRADELCLIDVTYEATEIGIVRDGVLRYSTHTPFGIFSLAREISEITNVPLHEAFAGLKSGSIDSITKDLLPEKVQTVEKVLDVYTDKIASLFHETGDTLSIPKRLALHVDHGAEPLFADLVKNASKRATHIDHSILSVSGELIDEAYRGELVKHVGSMCNDTALAVNAAFFHTEKHESTFTYY